MKDHRTVAFDIKSPSGTPLLTIWHVDPQRSGPSRGLATYDSCGWFTPPSCKRERFAVLKAGEDEYSTLFARRYRRQISDGQPSFAYDPTCHEAVFYAWQQIRRVRSGRRVEPSESERAAIFSLANDPIDNLRSSFDSVWSPRDCGDFFMLVFKAQLRFDRPRWRHPRWHVWHWRLQWHLYETVRRRLFDRCEGCGKPFRGTSPFSSRWENDRPGWFQSTPGLYHQECLKSRDEFTHHLRKIKLNKALGIIQEGP